MTAPDARLTLRAHEVAELLGVSRSVVYAWLRSGRIPHVRVGTTVLIPRQALEDWLARETRHKGA